MMAALPSIVGRSLTLVASHIPFGPGFKQNRNHLYQPGSRRLVQGGITSGLRHVYVRPLGNQEAHRPRVAAQGNTCVEWLIAHRVVRETVYVCAMGKQKSRRLGSAKPRCQVERSPAVG